MSIIEFKVGDKVRLQKDHTDYIHGLFLGKKTGTVVEVFKAYAHIEYFNTAINKVVRDSYFFTSLVKASPAISNELKKKK